MNQLASPLLEGPQINIDTFREQGVYILRGIFNKTDAENIQSTWQDYYAGTLQAARKASAHPKLNVPISEDIGEHPVTLSRLYRHPALVAIATQILGPDVAFYNNRLTMKDEHFRGAIGVHSDYPYNCGLGQKISFFVPLTPASAANGSLYFMLKSHHLGYCGGIPKLDHTEFPEFPAICPELSVGDAVVCDYHMWHYSLPAEFTGERVLFQIIYQPANDGSGRATLVSGKWKTDVFMNAGLFGRIWKNSTRNLEVNDLMESVLAHNRQTADLEREIDALRAENAELRRQAKPAA